MYVGSQHSNLTPTYPPTTRTVDAVVMAQAHPHQPHASMDGAIVSSGAALDLHGGNTAIAAMHVEATGTVEGVLVTGSPQDQPQGSTDYGSRRPAWYWGVLMHLLIDVLFWVPVIVIALGWSGNLGLEVWEMAILTFFMCVVAVVAYASNWADVCNNVIADHIRVESSARQLEAHVARLQATRPLIAMSVVCSHQHPDSSVPVVTHRAEQEFHYDDVTDESAPFAFPHHEDSFHLKVTTKAHFVDAFTASRFEDEYRAFIAANTRDEIVESSYRCVVAGLIETQLINEREGPPVHPAWQITAAFFCMQWLCWLVSVDAGSVTCEIVKTIRRQA
jgi:hypothetical protein